MKKIPIFQIFRRNFFQKVLMKIDEMEDVFLNLANFDFTFYLEPKSIDQDIKS